MNLCHYYTILNYSGGEWAAKNRIIFIYPYLCELVFVKRQNA